MYVRNRVMNKFQVGGVNKRIWLLYYYYLLLVFY